LRARRRPGRSVARSGISRSDSALSSLEELRTRLRDDFPFYAEHILKVEDKQRQVPFVLRPPQVRLWDDLQAQREAGRPMRAIILKSRKLGFSTMAQGLLLQRATMRPNHSAMSVAHDGKTAKKLFSIAENMYAQIPTGGQWDELALKPAQANRRRGQELVFGEPAKSRKAAGHLGLNSSMIVDTANELASGRGMTIHTLHCSEIAFWADINTKMTSLLNTIPRDDPDTLVLVESTALGENEFKGMWERAEAGKSDFIPFFVSWLEDPTNVKAFGSDRERAEFEASVGSGEWGEEEELLIAEYGASLEQVNWRRYALENIVNGDLTRFNQEYPLTPGHAFSSSGRRAFPPHLLREVRKRVEVTDAQGEHVVLTAEATTPRKGKFVELDVPTVVKAEAKPDRFRGDLFWQVWERPKPKGQYVIVVDPASGEENTDREPDFSAVQILDHLTGLQVAQLHSRAESDLLSEQVFLAAVWFSTTDGESRKVRFRPLVAVEVTGGYGDAVRDRVWKDYGWPSMYSRTPTDRLRERTSDLVGWSTNRGTKPLLKDTLTEELRDGTDGIRSLELLKEAEGYTRGKRGDLKASGAGHDDLLMAWMIAKYIAREKSPRPERRLGALNVSTRRTVNARMGY
jgi:hypothetical protein